ncbi:enolase C-terminal domain-like protein [Nonomuraea typhae]|uniref:enolase C-terminal domain-like protein n=1 Tax=Nonomuraea typhae TaxID=2603600 RepID=UPI0012F86E65|nr:enolase C-terminal domain-like protein [Nonomuraea typhae]
MTAEAESADGRLVRGRGASMLSVPWAWPRSPLGWRERDRALRELTDSLCDQAGRTAPGDPLTIFDELEAHLDARDGHLNQRGGRPGPRNGHMNAPDGSGPMPRLAAALALGAVDNAVHDAWARAAGKPAADLYPDLLGVPAWGPPRTRLPVQHVVGVGDPLDEVRAWLARDGIRHVKVKAAGRDPEADAARVTTIHALLSEATAKAGAGAKAEAEAGAGARAKATAKAGTAARAGAAAGATVSVDLNEGYASPADAVAMIDALPPEVLAGVTYLEQPVARDAPPDPDGMRELTRRLPVLADESLAATADLERLAADGWSGVVVKAARGQSLALRSWRFARERGLAAMVQDLTAVDLGLAHSARLAASLPWSWPAFECNSRQYAPGANAGLDFMNVVDGHLTLAPPGPGLA